ncbi:hypothetical protein [Streptomyces winkii]|uniref:hypothetical protein n=1 Tax=Streptomyces winkii TaxID=3051178 RepID=UPI0028D1E362|nr:hypothetical protein [Streptomyces sp. DSM 40971]
MSTPLTPSVRARAAAALVGLLIGAAAGVLLTETVAAFLALVLDRAPDVDGSAGLLALFIAVPVLCGVAGSVIGARRYGRPARQNGGW